MAGIDQHSSFGKPDRVYAVLATIP